MHRKKKGNFMSEGKLEWENFCEIEVGLTIFSSGRMKKRIWTENNLSQEAKGREELDFEQFVQQRKGEEEIGLRIICPKSKKAKGSWT